MAKVKLLEKKMTEKDVEEYGSSLRLFDGSTHVLIGKECLHTHTKNKRPISQCYSDIRNVKNAEGVIVGKRVSPHSSLLFTTEAFQPARKVTQVYKAPKMPRRSTQVRPRNTSGRAKKVSVLLSETGYANVHQLKQVLLDAGAKKVQTYNTSKGIAIVCHPNYLLQKIISE
ncbi:hypothetical protein [Bacillus inaquosorum]|uniref:hypothetical protein n=1 Tax=Bacillus subtilis group TaxID=653685 RepID=UPI002281AD68|nr:hypothetical protein [Bacillus inaquosorum]MCY7751703.1 hypothetical protein [Bacillus inaquosorum]